MSRAQGIDERIQIAERYYDSEQADRFYHAIWGGEDIHIGIYDTPDDSIAAASRRTVERMTSLLPRLDADTRVLDLGAGYGGSARYLASIHGCHVTCLNLSEVQNATNRKANLAQGLSARVEVRHGNFEAIPYADSSFDVVWSQDAFLHSPRKDTVLQEAERVLKPGGQLVFTDPMQSDDCPPGVLQAVLERIHLDSLGSFASFRQQLGELGMREEAVVDLSPQLRNHYRNVREALQGRYEEMCERSTRDYVDRMLTGLSAWVQAADRGHLAWGFLHFSKPER